MINLLIWRLIERLTLNIVNQNKNTIVNLSNRLKNAKRDRQSKQYDGVNDWNYDEEIRWPDSEIKTSDKTRFDRLYGNVVNGDIRNLSKVKQREGARQIGRYNRNGDEWNNEKKKWVPKDGQK